MQNGISVMQDKRLLVVGGTGVISFAVVNEALKQGWKVTCINRGISHTQTLSPDVEQIISDYRNETLIREKLKGRIYDAVQRPLQTISFLLICRSI